MLYSVGNVASYRRLQNLSFVRKLVTNPIHRENILRLAGFDFNFATDILDMGINCAFVGFKCHTMNGIQ